MALDFPSSPTNGQTYGNYYYDATVGAWNSFSSTVNTIPSTLKNLSVTTDGVGLVPLTVNGASGQTANLQNWKNSAGTTVASINNDGVISAATLNLTNDLTVSNGGTGAGTFTTGAYLKGNGTSAIQAQTGIPFADVTMQSIGAAADLNTYVTQGIYHQSSNANASGGANYPAPYAGLLEVFQSGVDGSGFTYQRYTTYKEQLAAYTRAKYTTTWSAWQREGTQAEVVALVPAGTVTQTARSTAPSGWLLCDGSAVSRTTYATLFSAISTTYGVGDGSTTFNLPNLQGRVPAGKSASGTFATLGATGGAETVALDGNNLPAHTHTFSGTTSTGGSHAHTIYGALVNRGTGTQFRELTESSNPSQNNVASAAAGDHSHTYSGTTSSSGSGTAHNNLQPYIVLNYMIKV